MTRDDVLAEARRRFLRGERIDLVAIAGALGLARATLYRWIGDRDVITGEVLLSLAQDTLRAVVARPRPAGGTGVAIAVVELMRAVSGHPAMRGFIAADPQRAIALLTGPESVVAAGLGAEVEALIAAECPAAVTAELPSDELAYAVLRLGEAYCYADVVATRPVEVDRALPLLERLLEPR